MCAIGDFVDRELDGPDRDWTEVVEDCMPDGGEHERDEYREGIEDEHGGAEDDRELHERAVVLQHREGVGCTLD